MKAKEYARLADLEQTYWWHLGRLRIIQGYVQRANKNKRKPKLLNVGCGTGGTVEMLEAIGQTDNVDISDQAIAFMKRRGYTRITKVSGLTLPFRAKTYDVVTALDVLEHIEQQIDALGEWKRVIKDDGAIIITVPAYQWLWSSHDVSLHHKRRYTARQLAQAAKTAGLRVEKRSYAIVFSLPLVVGFRLLGRLTQKSADSNTSYVAVPSWMNRLFTNLLYIESRLHGVTSFPAGTSLIAVLRKAN